MRHSRTAALPKIHRVRHGEPAAAFEFDSHLDPRPDDPGRARAAATAAELAPLGPLPLYSSPLARARETALLLRHWNTSVVDLGRSAQTHVS